MNSTGGVVNAGFVPYPSSPGGGRDITDVVVLSCPISTCEENPEELLPFKIFDGIGFDVADFMESELL